MVSWGYHPYEWRKKTKKKLQNKVKNSNQIKGVPFGGSSWWRFGPLTPLPPFGIVPPQTWTFRGEKDAFTPRYHEKSEFGSVVVC